MPPLDVSEALLFPIGACEFADGILERLRRCGVDSGAGIGFLDSRVNPLQYGIGAVEQILLRQAPCLRNHERSLRIWFGNCQRAIEQCRLGCAVVQFVLDRGHLPEDARHRVAVRALIVGHDLLRLEQLGERRVVVPELRFDGRQLDERGGMERVVAARVVQFGERERAPEQRLRLVEIVVLECDRSERRASAKVERIDVLAAGRRSGERDDLLPAGLDLFRVLAIYGDVQVVQLGPLALRADQVMPRAEPPHVRLRDVSQKLEHRIQWHTSPLQREASLAVAREVVDLQTLRSRQALGNIARGHVDDVDRDKIAAARVGAPGPDVGPVVARPLQAHLADAGLQSRRAIAGFPFAVAQAQVDIEDTVAAVDEKTRRVIDVKLRIYSHSAACHRRFASVSVSGCNP